MSSTEENRKKFPIMRAFQRDPQDLGRGRLGEVRAYGDDDPKCISYHLECSPYWPFPTEHGCAVRVKAIVSTPEGTMIELDPQGGPPQLHIPDGRRPLTGAELLRMTREELAERLLVLSIIS